MKAVFSSLMLFALVTIGSAAAARFTVNDPFAGTYYGSYETPFAQGVAEAQIRALGNNTYDGFIILRSMREGKESVLTICKVREFQVADGKAEILGEHPDAFLADRDGEKSIYRYAKLTVNAVITPGAIEGEFSGGFVRQDTSKLALTRSTPKPSPTLGAQPPADAVVLFDGKPNGEWREMNWSTKDGVLEVGEGNITTKKNFTNALLHVEFRTPYMPEARGQARGNSGVYLRSVFEVQVLDSFGIFPPETNDSGGIYQVAAPDWEVGNASLPPGTWQTYDITYRAGSEKDNRPTTISVVHNGKLVISNAEIPAELSVNGTGGGQVGGGFLMLQHHGNPVQYRNIWVQPID